MAQPARHSVMVAYPHGGVVENCFLESIVGMLVYDGQTTDSIVPPTKGAEGLYIANNRELLARTFMRMKNTDGKPLEWLVTIDTDIAFEPDTVHRLIDSADPVERPIMSVLYFGYMDGAHLGPVWYGREENGRFKHLPTFNSGIQRLGSVGMGLCAIHRSVFEKFGTKWAYTGFLYFGHDVAPWLPAASIENDIMTFGEDNCFCYRCDQLGIPIYGNGSIVVQHRKKRYEDLSTFLSSFAHSDVEADEKGANLKLKRRPPADLLSPSHREVSNGVG